VRHRILVVDDEPMIRLAVQRTLSKEHEVVAAENARDALARVKAGERFDVVFCDLMMPEMTGMDLHAQLARATPDLAEQMIFVTGGAFTPTAMSFLDRVPNERIDKPFDPARIRALVQDRLG
jgi:CheY-like chemotaxis protein